MFSHLVIIALSARALAQSATRAGYRPVSIDIFGDIDTIDASLQARVAPTVEHRIDSHYLYRTLSSPEFSDRGYGLIYGSGVDSKLDLLDWCEKHFRLCGNSAEVVAHFVNPERFFSLLTRLNIPYPRICYERPSSNQGWLFKQVMGEGGKSITEACELVSNADGYYQRKINGPACSILFVANGQSSEIIGYNTQFVQANEKSRPYIFSGMINRAPYLAKRQRLTLAFQVQRLVQETGLVGLNSLDFIIDNGVCRILELNPRPSASITLYDSVVPNGLLVAHLAGCRGESLEITYLDQRVRGFKIVYCPWPVTLEHIRWPQWCSDKPARNAQILTNQPLCTVNASGLNIVEVETKLAQREQKILSLVNLKRVD